MQGLVEKEKVALPFVRSGRRRGLLLRLSSSRIGYTSSLSLVAFVHEGSTSPTGLTFLEL